MEEEKQYKMDDKEEKLIEFKEVKEVKERQPKPKGDKSGKTLCSGKSKEVRSR